jgi:cytochrome c-type biogenesis protein CcmE
LKLFEVAEVSITHHKYDLIIYTPVLVHQDVPNALDGDPLRLRQILVNLTSSLVYFNTPTELTEQGPSGDRQRLGGQVVAGSATPTTDGVEFLVTDGRESVPVIHVGAPPQLFQEGIGVVVEGVWDGEQFRSDTMLVKHDEQSPSEDGVYESDDSEPDA